MNRLTCTLRTLAILAVVWAWVTPAAAQYQRRDTQDLDGLSRDAVLARARTESGIDEKLGNTLPLDAVFQDSDGREVRLGEVFERGRPVVLQMAYYRCPALCGEVMNGMVRAMRDLSEELAIGDDFEVLTISFDSRESAELAKANKDATVDVMGRTFDRRSVEAGWGFWVGPDLHIRRLTDALGFRFAWIPEAQQYIHAGTIVVATPDGVVSRYLHGPTFDPRTLRLSVIDASNGTLRPSLQDAFIYYCFSYDPHTGRYTATARTVMMIGGAVTVAVLAGVIGFLLYAERRGRLRRHPMAGTPADDAGGPTSPGDDRSTAGWSSDGAFREP